MFQIDFRNDLYAVDPDSLVHDEWNQVAIELGTFAMRTGIEPDLEVKAAAVALIVVRRDPRFGSLPFSEFVEAPDVQRERSAFDDLTVEQQIAVLMGLDD